MVGQTKTTSKAESTSVYFGTSYSLPQYHSILAYDFIHGLFVLLEKLKVSSPLCQVKQIDVPSQEKVGMQDQRKLMDTWGGWRKKNLPSNGVYTAEPTKMLSRFPQLGCQATVVRK